MSAPIACTLPDPEIRDRLAQIAKLARRALLWHEQKGSTLRLRYSSDAADELDRLVVQERDCCAFLDFDLARRPDGVHLVIKAPAGAAEFVSVLTSPFLGSPQPQARGCSASCDCGAAA